MAVTEAAPEVSTAREAMASFETSSGATLLEESAGGNLLVVFLRHAGCTFCREALADLANRRETIESSGARIVLVHMSRDDSMENLAAKYGLGDSIFVRDVDRELYRAFQLKRGNLWQLFGPKVIIRGIAATLRGHMVGKLAGDGFQMPGAFLVRDGVILKAFRHETAGDRPDYAGMASP